MQWPSVLRRKDPPASPPGAADDASVLLRARTGARRRLIGAVVLLGIGIIGFPLLFETQPRPIPVDIPIEIPRKDAVPPLTAPRSARPAPPADAEPAPALTPVPAQSALAQPAPLPPAVVRPASAAVPGATRPLAAPPPSADARAQRPSDATERAASSPAAGPTGARYVLQVGAYAEASAVREVRAKIERMGLKSYIQTVDTEAGNRTRVRIGPFEARSAAQAAADKLKAAGLPFNLLEL